MLLYFKDFLDGLSPFIPNNAQANQNTSEVKFRVSIGLSLLLQPRNSIK